MMSFVVVGQVDHGKSTFCGHLLYLTKNLDNMEEREMQKLELEAKNNPKLEKYKLSRIMDIWEEERERNKTHEFQLVDFKYNEKNYQLIDTPGHKSFIRSMIKGIYQKESNSIIGCLVVSVSKGEFESGFGNGQTKEDALLVRAVGITNLIVLINKMDEIAWDELLYKEYCSKLDKFLKKLKFQTITYIPISGLLGIGLLNTKGMPDWYINKSGKSFIDIIDNLGTKTIGNEEKREDNTVYQTKELLVQFNILNASLITIGYEGICHYNGGEVNYQLNKILTINDKPFNTNGNCYSKSEDRMTCMINLEDVIDIRKGDRLLFRDKEQTVGFGKVLKLKPHKK
ncbi:MAG: GTP binding translation elongation factor [Edafosvirus sp.]|uniref:GTP binding translation elongation factor n=1 Tax=Edafosvirus sp. TaxID=2487765 RepID=A0A3G4ZSR0_9VIRU|nr:MAG: GTP binding translation elongation factor [Edafosvirus sp.]